MMRFHLPASALTLERSGAGPVDLAPALAAPRAPETAPLSGLRCRWVTGESGRPEMRWDLAAD